MEIHSSMAPAAILPLGRLGVLAHRRQRRMYRITTRRWEAAAQENFNLDLRFFSSYGNHKDTETQWGRSNRGTDIEIRLLISLSVPESSSIATSPLSFLTYVTKETT